ncbi:MAG: class I SAM-dependent methyltransferase [Chloroflexi bacterium]|nr:class I SAM-dependent methyltransferase [Chloroflexota bacterium]
MNLASANVSTAPGECPICGAAAGRYAQRGYYYKCSTCKVAFRPRQESASDLDEYWQEDFWTAREIQKRKDREPVFRHAYELLDRERPQGGSVLDIGCGIGTFVAVCREGGWEATGVEPSVGACRVAREEYGLELINAPFTSALFPEKAFDAVFAAQVVHHLPDPVGFLADVSRVLADGGLLMLRTPNLIPLEPGLLLQRAIGRERDFFLGPALYAFHPDTWSLLLGRLGFRDVTFANSRPYIERPAPPGPGGEPAGAGLRRLAVTAAKRAGYGAVEAIRRGSGGRAVVGSSIFVLARKG